MHGVMTSRRVRCLSHINCYGGWTTRPYSVLERTVITLDHMWANGYSDDEQKFVLLRSMYTTMPIEDNKGLFDSHGFDPLVVDPKNIEVLGVLVMASERVTVCDTGDDSQGSPHPDIIRAILYDHKLLMGNFVPSFTTHYERLFGC